MLGNNSLFCFLWSLIMLWTNVNGGAIVPSEKCIYNSTSPSQRGNTFMIVGHAGGDPINHCENTVEATRSAIASGANAIEIDLSISKDGVIFLWHDPNPWDFYSIIRRY
uniref:GP-PDE domain-containing protein n=1 Tax=Lepeophtheirus salmonis TaxID=72036 RepID=A0A0K2TNI7_LEPSM